jgi:hypothetical protein
MLNNVFWIVNWREKWKRTKRSFFHRQAIKNNTVTEFVKLNIGDIKNTFEIKLSSERERQKLKGSRNIPFHPIIQKTPNSYIYIIKCSLNNLFKKPLQNRK